MNTLAYLSPEILQDTPPTKESDVYAFSMLIFEGYFSLYWIVNLSFG